MAVGERGMTKDWLSGGAKEGPLRAWSIRFPSLPSLCTQKRFPIQERLSSGGGARISPAWCNDPGRLHAGHLDCVSGSPNGGCPGGSEVRDSEVRLLAFGLLYSLFPPGLSKLRPGRTAGAPVTISNLQASHCLASPRADCAFLGREGSGGLPALHNSGA